MLKTDNLPLADTTLCLFTDSMKNKSKEDAPRLETLFKKACKTDPIPQRILQMLKDSICKCKDITRAECEDNDGQLQCSGATFSPNHASLKLLLTQEHHTLPGAGHPGGRKALELLSHSYYWPNMSSYMDPYLHNCNIWIRSKAICHAPHVVHRSLTIPISPGKTSQ